MDGYTLFWYNNEEYGSVEGTIKSKCIPILILLYNGSIFAMC